MYITKTVHGERGLGRYYKVRRTVAEKMSTRINGFNLLISALGGRDESSTF